MQREQIGDERTGVVQRLGRAPVRDRTFVTGDAGEAQTRGPEHALGEGEGRLGRAGARAPTRAAELDEYLEAHATGEFGACGDAREQVDARVAVDPRPEPPAVLGDIERERGRGLGIGELVREHDVADAYGAGHPHLPGRREREGGRPGILLQAPQLRGHRRLAVRHEFEAAARDPPSQKRRVPLEGRRVDDEGRSPELGQPHAAGDECLGIHARRPCGHRLVVSTQHATGGHPLPRHGQAWASAVGSWATTSISTRMFARREPTVVRTGYGAVKNSA